MKSTISKLMEEIDERRKKLAGEYDKLRKKYNFEWIKGKISFSKEQKIEYKKKKRKILSPQGRLTFREILSGPFIYIMIVPAVILDVFLIMYQNTALRLYRIPLVKRKDYINLDRKELGYLNWLEKINCLYCSYVNGLFSMAVEIAGRTEKYWCPIKHARKQKTIHSWQKYFADYGDADSFREVYRKNHEFKNEK